MITRTAIRIVMTLLVVFTARGHQLANAQVLVGDAFISPNSNWVDAFPDRAGNWRINLVASTPTLMDTNNANPPTSGAVTNSGVYEPDVLIKDTYTTPANGVYDLTARMHSNDDDIIGLVWNYQDPDNYFRVGIRQQAAGSFGGTQGLAVQKIVGGVLTQISPAVIGPGAASPITQTMIDTRTPFDLTVSVNDNNWAVLFNGASIIGGVDDDLVGGRKIGVQSWAQQTDNSAITPFWGTEVETISVADASGTLFSESFNSTVTKWRHLNMTNAAGISIPINGVVAGSTTANRDDHGDFGQDVNDPWILQHGNGFEDATTNNTDFIGPAIVIDEPGSDSYSDYAMRVRIGSTDDDGVGVLVRAQDDDNFYRINFTNQAPGVFLGRPFSGMSVQKVRDGVWSELFSEADGAALFLPVDNPNGTTPNDAEMEMFDLIVQAVGNRLSIRVIDHNGNVFVYDPIYDNDNPLLTGTVGLTTWGNDNTYFTGYGGGSGPLLTAVPEPSTIALALLAGLGLFGWSRRRK